MVVAAITSPVKEHQVPGFRYMVTRMILSPLCEPPDPFLAGRELRDKPCLQIPTLVRAPADKAGAPWLAALKSIPAPVRLPALVPQLTFGHLYQQAALCHAASTVLVIAHHMRHVLRVPISGPAVGCGLLLGKHQGIGFAVAAKVTDSPGDIPISV